MSATVLVLLLLLLVVLVVIAVVVLLAARRRSAEPVPSATSATPADPAAPMHAAAGTEARADAAQWSPEASQEPQPVPEQWLDEHDAHAAAEAEAAADHENTDPGTDAEVSGPDPLKSEAREWGDAAAVDVAGEDAADDDVPTPLAVDEPAPVDDTAEDSTPLYRTLKERMETALAEGPETSATDATDVEAGATDAEVHTDVDVVIHDPDLTTTDNAEAGAADTDVDDPAPGKDDEFMTTSETEGAVTDEFAEDSVDAAAQADGVDEDVFPVVRVSELHEVVDGGFGIGSAAPLEDGAQPLGHPIKANLDTKTYQDLHSPWYVKTQPDVWFLDAGFAERAGFHRAE